MRIERFDPEADPARTRACYQVHLAGAPVDDPHYPPMSLRSFTGWLACGWTEDQPEVWSASPSPDRVDGCYTVAMPRRENRHLAYVHPGRGITEVRRILDLTAVPAGALTSLRAEAREASRGYRVLCWEGTVPEEHLGQVAAVNGAMADAPHDAATQAQSWDADRVRAGQRRIVLQGQRYYSVAAQCARSGELAGLTQLGVDPEIPGWGFQELTAVTRPHRGHRLGLLLKVAMLDLLAEREPQLKWVVTGNADSNSHMVAINALLGFQPVDSWASWQLDVAQVLAIPRAH